MKKIVLMMLLAPVMVWGQITRPVTGEYTGSYQAASQKSKEQLWENSVDYFTKGGFTVKSLDKENGIAVVVTPDIMPSFTYEKKKGGGVEDPAAYVVLEKIKNLDPVNIHLTINLRVSDNKIICSTSNVEVKSNKPRKTKWRYFYGAKSTGNYERVVVDAIR